MGATITCNNCCLQRQYYAGIKSIYTPGSVHDRDQKHPDLMQALITLPDPSYARPVSNVIDLTSTVRRTYKEQKQPLRSRISDLRGTVLQSFYIFNWNAYYDGEWKDGLPHGQGRLYYDCGSLYEGPLNKGVIDGEHGLYIFPNGSYYKGAFRNDAAHGNGIYKSEDVYYVGEWANSQPHGKGIQITEGCRYDGEFCAGKKQGRGKIVWANQILFIGDFKDNQIEGRGTLQTKSYIYEGQMKNSKKWGFGMITYKNGNVFQGDFVQDNRQGDGSFTWNNGAKFIGKFQKDKQHGHGKLSLPDGSVMEGEWTNGELAKNPEENLITKQQDKQNRFEHPEAPEQHRSIKQEVTA